MEFVKLTISSTKRYHYQDASTVEMGILGNFLASDVGDCSSLFETWALDDSLQNTNGALTRLEKKENYITLTTLDIEKKNSAAIKMPQEQFMQILTDWQEKVCKLQPQSVVIRYDFYNFLIETGSETELKIETQENNPITLFPLTPYQYPLWIKTGFSTCCIFFSLYLYNLSHYIKLTKKVQRAYRIFAQRNYAEACLYLTKLHKKIPHNKTILLYLAQSLFKSNNTDDHRTALELLANQQLNEREWCDLLKYMPREYTVFFQNIQKDKK